MKYKLDLEDDIPEFEGWAFLLFHTPLPSYVLADTLNRLYDYRLARLDNLLLGDTGWPLYLHNDGIGHLQYFLLERPATATVWDDGDKLLVLSGENAEAEAERIYAEFSELPAYDPADLLAKEHADLLTSLLSSFTMVNLLDLAGSDTSSRKIQRGRITVKQCCQTIIESIEKRQLDLGDDERRRAGEKLFLQN